MEEIFYDIFAGLPRQGPGSSQSTKMAIQSIESIPNNPIILDLGCGSGLQTFQLAHHLGGKIIALDNHKPYLEALMEQAKKQGYDDIIDVTMGEMNNLDFPEQFFDVIWAEGSIYIIGFQEGLNYLKPFLKDSGTIAVTEISWLKDNPPSDLVDFWEQEYALMNTVDGNIKIIGDLGYGLVDSFILSPSAWWDDYYLPLEKRLIEMRKKYMENYMALELVEFVQLEIDLYRKYPEFYGYVFYVMQKS